MLKLLSLRTSLSRLNVSKYGLYYEKYFILSKSLLPLITFPSFLLEQVRLGHVRTAIDILLAQIVGKKHRDWTKEYENIMILLFDLCVELRDANTAKDAIHNYRNMCQHVSYLYGFLS